MKARCRFFQAEVAGERVWMDMGPDRDTVRGTYEGSPAVGVLAFLATLEPSQLLTISHDFPGRASVILGNWYYDTQWNAFVYYLEKPQ